MTTAEGCLGKKLLTAVLGPMMTTKMAASHKGDTRIGEVFPRRTNGTAGRGGLHLGKPGNEVVVSTVRSDGTVKCQTAGTRRGTASVSKGAHRLLWEEQRKQLFGGRYSPKFSLRGAESCEPFEAVAGWAAG
jgi:hypothetical protein